MSRSTYNIIHTIHNKERTDGNPREQKDGEGVGDVVSTYNISYTQSTPRKGQTGIHVNRKTGKVSVMSRPPITSYTRFTSRTGQTGIYVNRKTGKMSVMSRSTYNIIHTIHLKERKAGSIRTSMVGFRYTKQRFLLVDAQGYQRFCLF